MRDAAKLMEMHWDRRRVAEPFRRWRDFCYRRFYFRHAVRRTRRRVAGLRVAEAFRHWRAFVRRDKKRVAMLERAERLELARRRRVLASVLAAWLGETARALVASHADEANRRRDDVANTSRLEGALEEAEARAKEAGARAKEAGAARDAVAREKAALDARVETLAAELEALRATLVRSDARAKALEEARDDARGWMRETLASREKERIDEREETVSDERKETVSASKNRSPAPSPLAEHDPAFLETEARAAKEAAREAAARAGGRGNDGDPSPPPEARTLDWGPAHPPPESERPEGGGEDGDEDEDASGDVRVDFDSEGSDAEAYVQSPPAMLTAYRDREPRTPDGEAPEEEGLDEGDPIGFDPGDPIGDPRVDEGGSRSTAPRSARTAPRSPASPPGPSPIPRRRSSRPPASRPPGSRSKAAATSAAARLGSSADRLGRVLREATPTRGGEGGAAGEAEAKPSRDDSPGTSSVPERASNRIGDFGDVDDASSGSPLDPKKAPAPPSSGLRGGLRGGLQNVGLRPPSRGVGGVAAASVSSSSVPSGDPAAYASPLARALFRAEEGGSRRGVVGGSCRTYARVRPLALAADGPMAARTPVALSRSRCSATRLAFDATRGGVAFARDYAFDRVFWPSAGLETVVDAAALGSSSSASSASVRDDVETAASVASPMAAAVAAGTDATLLVVGAGAGGKTRVADAVVAALVARLGAATTVRPPEAADGASSAMTLSISAYETRGHAVDDLLAPSSSSGSASSRPPLRVQPRVARGDEGGDGDAEGGETGGLLYEVPDLTRREVADLDEALVALDLIRSRREEGGSPSQSRSPQSRSRRAQHAHSARFVEVWLTAVSSPSSRSSAGKSPGTTSSESVARRSRCARVVDVFSGPSVPSGDRTGAPAFALHQCVRGLVGVGATARASGSGGGSGATGAGTPGGAGGARSSAARGFGFGSPPPPPRSPASLAGADWRGSATTKLCKGPLTGEGTLAVLVATGASEAQVEEASVAMRLASAVRLLPARTFPDLRPFFSPPQRGGGSAKKADEERRAARRGAPGPSSGAKKGTSETPTEQQRPSRRVRGPTPSRSNDREGGSAYAFGRRLSEGALASSARRRERLEGKLAAARGEARARAMRGEGGAAFEGREFTSMFERDSAAAAAEEDARPAGLGAPWIRDGVDALVELAGMDAGADSDSDADAGPRRVPGGPGGFVGESSTPRAFETPRTPGAKFAPSARSSARRGAGAGF